MKVPYKPIYLPRGPKKYKYIIIHDMNCHENLAAKYKVDGEQFQTNSARSTLYRDDKYYELPFHYVCEKIKDDFQTVVARPLQYSCESEYPDLNKLYSRFGIHIGIMGNFNIIGTEPRMLQQICYRAITPLMKIYGIMKSNIYLHGELSTDNLDCPGYNFTKQKLFAYIGPFLITQTS